MRQTRRVCASAWCALLLCTAPVLAAQIEVRLTGSLEYPGLFSLKGETFEVGRICFLGEDAHGYVDADFLQALAERGVPAGSYRISAALPQEQWPVGEFVKNGALRLVPETPQAVETLLALGKKGLAVHGRDFYPLASRITKNSKMVRFVSDRLFDRLIETWGTLRISNWDLGRLHDFYRKTRVVNEAWILRVDAGELEMVRSICEPLKVQRKPGGPLE